MNARRARWWRWPLLGLLVGTTLVSVGAYWIWFVTEDLARVETDFAIPMAMLVDAAISVIALVWMIPGLVVLRRANWHPVGWMLVATGLGYALSFDMGEAAVWDVLGVPHHWAAWVADGWGKSVAFTFTSVLLSVFPDGLPREAKPRRWGWFRILAALAALSAAGLATTVGGLEGATFDTETFPNPTGLGFVPPLVADWMFLVVLLSMAGSAFALWRRARHVEASRRSQYTWVLFPFGAMIAALLVAIPLSGLLGDSVWLVMVFMYFLVPVAFSIAIVRHRLFDIDRLVSRTVTYAVVALVVAAIYVVPVLVLPDLLGLSGDVAVAGATLLAAAAFAPMRRMVQARVNRRFNRARYDAEQVVAGFSVRLQTAVDLRRVTEELNRAVGTALHPATVSVWFSEGVGA